MILRAGWASSILVLVFGSFCGLASADTVTIGTNTAGNVFPFTSPNYVGEYQQVYDGSLFSGPVEITGITFFDLPGSTATINGDFALDLSTTTAGVDSLSTTYENNIGTNNTLFFNGTVSDVLSFTGGPFLYNPSQGNLLLDVEVIPPNSSGADLAAGCSADTNRVFNLAGTGAATTGNTAVCTASPTSYGLETEFTFTPVSTGAGVPEPSVLLMLSMGLLALFGAAKFKLLSS